ncbi:MAG TPA: serine/threonine-protein kinase [Polyangiaceae bacterium]|jgi:tRNA A-37 threonylcarbamoyl transferase component Bud32/tetratricopeptide (TPR) repeat protein
MGEKQGDWQASDVHSAETLAGGAASKRSVVPELTGVSGDYEIGGEIARGGMGRILEAYDRRRDRRVALKLLLSDSETTRKRFEREAWITGRLQHPAIVPLYEAGVLPSGEPFYAMKLVRGGSLREVIKTKGTLEERLTLLPHLIAMAEALAYAHQEGIVHRDLKSSNVLVGAFGETVVIDWGLAKVVAEPEESGERVAGFATASLGSGSGSGSTLTDQGRVLGTPQFMPPEQAGGLAIDARADVYSLGACMYHALSGVPPYEARDPGEAIRELLAGPPRPLAEAATGIPADLATIVAKAMARKKEDRYATAKGLAEDLQRFAAGRLVKAHVYTARELVRRWAVKHRAAVMVASAAVVALAVLAGVGVRRIARERDSARVARVEAEGAAKRAEAQRQAAESLIASLVGDFRDKLIPVGRLDVMTALGNRVLEYYRSAPVQNEAGDPSALLRRAEAMATLAGAYEVEIQLDSAISVYRDAINLCLLAKRLAPDERTADKLRAYYLYRIALIEQLRNQLTESVTTSDESISAYEQLIPDPSLANLAKSRIALVLGTKGETIRNMGDNLQAYETQSRGIALLETLQEQEYRPVETPRNLAWLYAWRALCAARGDIVGGLIDARKSLELREKLLSADESNGYLTNERDLSLIHISQLLLRSGEERTLLSTLRNSSTSLTELIQKEPANNEWQRGRADAEALLCRAALATGLEREARTYCEASATEEEKQAQKSTNANSSQDLANSIEAMGEFEANFGSPLAALASFRQSEATTKWSAVPVGSTNVWLPRPHPLTGQAIAELRLKRSDEALRDASLAQDAWELAERASLSDAFIADSANAALLVVGDAHLALHDTPAALASFTQAHDACTSLLTRDPDDVYVKLHCAEADAKLASVTTDPAAASPLRDEARALLAKVGPAYVRGLGKQAWVDGLRR